MAEERLSAKVQRNLYLAKAGIPKVRANPEELGYSTQYPVPLAPSYVYPELQLPHTVYILGTGANADYSLIPHSAFTIALNKAICFYDADIWVCATTAYHCTDWWHEIAMQKDTIRVFGELLSIHSPAHYSFKYLPDFQTDPLNVFLPGILRTATIAGSALNLCKDKNVRKVVFNGVDMFGNGYVDGTTNPQKPHANLIWNERDGLQAMINLCKNSFGMQIYTQTDTYLDLEREG